MFGKLQPQVFKGWLQQSAGKRWNSFQAQLATGQERPVATVWIDVKWFRLGEKNIQEISGDKTGPCSSIFWLFQILNPSRSGPAALYDKGPIYSTLWQRCEAWEKWAVLLFVALVVKADVSKQRFQGQEIQRHRLNLNIVIVQS